MAGGIAAAAAAAIAVATLLLWSGSEWAGGSNGDAQCDMSFMYPQFRLALDRSGGHRLYRYTDSRHPPVDAPSLVLLFLPGNAGSFKVQEKLK
jgi:hypothetical protein